MERASELVSEVEPAQPARGDLEQPIPFASGNGQFVLVDNLDELTLTDTETGQTVSLPFAPESLRVEQ
jgi:hypothetical protein